MRITITIEDCTIDIIQSLFGTLKSPKSKLESETVGHSESPKKTRKRYQKEAETVKCGFCGKNIKLKSSVAAARLSKSKSGKLFCDKVCSSRHGWKPKILISGK